MTHLQAGVVVVNTSLLGLAALFYLFRGVRG